MLAAPPREKLANVDSAWLHMEEATNHMVVTILLIFEHRISYRRLRRLVEDRLLVVPRFRQRIVSPFLPFTAPSWAEDPDFNLDRHLEVAELEDWWDDASLRDVVSDAMSRTLDPAHPLWHFEFIPRYREGCALITRIHHCIGDGFGLMHVFLSMCDDADRIRLSLPAACSVATTSGLASTAFAVVDGLLTTAKLVLMPSDRATTLKGPLVTKKRAMWSTPVAVEPVKAVSRAMGASINDVLLTGVTGALRRYLELQEPVANDMHVRGVVPVNLRRNGDAHLLGNRFGLAFLPMPVGIADPVERLFEIRKATRAFKQSQEPIVTFEILRALGIAPGPVFDFVVSLFGRKATAVVTNVIGPREPLAYAGVKVSQAMFWVPCAGKLGLGISVLSYAGMVSIGFATDEGLIPRPEALIRAFDAELAQLFEYATVPA